MAFEAYGEQLESVPRFTYLGGGDDGGGRQLAGGSGEPKKGAEELRETIEDTAKGGSDTTDLGVLFQGGGAASTAVWG